MIKIMSKASYRSLMKELNELKEIKKDYIKVFNAHDKLKESCVSKKEYENILLRYKGAEENYYSLCDRYNSLDKELSLLKEDSDRQLKFYLGEYVLSVLKRLGC